MVHFPPRKVYQMKNFKKYPNQIEPKVSQAKVSYSSTNFHVRLKANLSNLPCQTVKTVIISCHLTLITCTLKVQNHINFSQQFLSSALRNCTLYNNLVRKALIITNIYRAFTKHITYSISFKAFHNSMTGSHNHSHSSAEETEVQKGIIFPKCSNQ